MIIFIKGKCLKLFKLKYFKSVNICYDIHIGGILYHPFMEGRNMKKIITGVAIGALGTGLIFGAVNMMQETPEETAGLTPPMGVHGYTMQQQVESDDAEPPYYGHGPGMMHNFRDTRGDGYGMMNGYGHMMGYGPGMMHGHGGMMGYGAETFHEDLAAFLEMTAEELYDAGFDGKTLLEIATEADITKEALVEEIIDIHTAQLDDWVDNKVMTEEQREWMTNHMNDMVTFMIEQKAFGPGGGYDGN